MAPKMKPWPVMVAEFSVPGTISQPCVDNSIFLTGTPFLTQA